MPSRLLLAASLLLSLHASAAEYARLHSFNTRHGRPQGTLLRDAAGNLYGTTWYDFEPQSMGTIFKIAPDGTKKDLYRFRDHIDGRYPSGPLIQDAVGNLYGVTLLGGGEGSRRFCRGARGCGTVFRLAPDGTKTVLHAFHGGHDGAYPIAGVIADAAGNLYGTTQYGGHACENIAIGCGTVFKIAPDGKTRILHAFTYADGAFPAARLTRDAAGNLYGTTNRGGGAADVGVVFRIAPDGTESTLYAFKFEADGGVPESEVLLDAAGNIYGTASLGGHYCDDVGCGTIFRLTPQGEFKVLHHFRGPDGATPMGGLIADTAGNLYGTTFRQMFHDPDLRGVVFKLAPDGSYSVLYEPATNDGSGGFVGSLIMDADGALYGTSRYGGAENFGTVFRLVP